jgi:hypothetical protein
VHIPPHAPIDEKQCRGYILRFRSTCLSHVVVFLGVPVLSLAATFSGCCSTQPLSGGGENCQLLGLRPGFVVNEAFTIFGRPTRDHFLGLSPKAGEMKVYVWNETVRTITVTVDDIDSIASIKL